MKRRVLRPYKILAVALGAGATVASLGCNDAKPRNDPGTAPTASPSTTASTLTLAASAAASAQTAAAASAQTAAAAAAAASAQTAAAERLAHAPAIDAKAEPKLLALRGELEQTVTSQVLSKQAHFRPLCDKDGYPLVGNIARKAPPAPGDEANLGAPSGFCAAVRANSKKPS